MTYVKSAFRIACAVAIAMALYVGLTFITVLYVGHTDDGNKADAVVVLGAAQYDGTPSPLLESRLQHALDLFTSGRVKFIAVTGGKMPGDRFTEAAASRRWLTDRGVSAANIISETFGHSTWESLHNLAPVLRTAGVQRVIVSSSAWHVQRCVLTLRELGFSVAASGAPSTTSDTYRELKESVGVAVGRIIGFHRLLSITG